MFNIVKESIDEFNPFGLLPRAPSNEFDNESKKIAAQIKVNSTAGEIAEIISKVLSKAFGMKFEYEECMPIAEKIYKAIKNR